LSRLRTEWRATAPIVSAGRGLFAAPDTAYLHCLDLRTGAVRWKAPRDDGDPYLARGTGGGGVRVGKQDCRGRHPTDRDFGWQRATGQPAGQGVAAGKVYWLPMKAAYPDKEPAVLALDMELGFFQARADAPDGDAPGNLVFAGDTVFSQTVTAVTAYPRAAEN